MKNQMDSFVFIGNLLLTFHLCCIIIVEYATVALETMEDIIMVMNRISIIARSCHVFSTRKLHSYDINSTEQTVLMLLNKNHNVNQDSIAKYFFVDKGTIAKTLNKLEQKGFIKRTVNKENKREKIISLTEKGEDSMECMKQVLEEWYNCIFEGLSENEIAALNKITEKMAVNATRALECN